MRSSSRGSSNSPWKARSADAMATAITAFDVDAARALGGPDWLTARRTEAAERFVAMPMPTTDEEIWKFSPVADLDLDRYRPVRPLDDCYPNDAQFVANVRALVATIADWAGGVILRNGAVLDVQLDAAAAAKGVEIAALASGQ